MEIFLWVSVFLFVDLKILGLYCVIVTFIFVSLNIKAQPIEHLASDGMIMYV